MRNGMRISLDYEEKRTVIWFLSLFYTIFLLHDILYYFVLPQFFWHTEVGFPSGGLDFLIYIVMFALLPVSYFLIKSDKIGTVKYVYFITFTTMNIVNDIWFYWGNDASYSSGNVVEIVIVLFTPIFVNKNFYYLVSFGTIFKFIIVGLIIQDSKVMLPLMVVIVLALIAYILLTRFISFVEVIKESYDEQMEGIVKGVITTLELKDPYTQGHSIRVAAYAMILAEAVGNFKKDQLKSFYYACLVHDIGKVHIPDSILTKAGKLTSEEYEIIKTHPVVGAEAMRNVPGIADNLDVIYHHHERWDGSGYPDGLKGEQTPILTRITAIADAFDAMTSSRSYRAALPLEEAYRRILAGKGTQFDPELVEVFKTVYPKWIEFHKKHHEQSSKL